MPTSVRGLRRSLASRRRALRDRQRQDRLDRGLYQLAGRRSSRRGFGIPKLCWAYESHTDMIARELGIDPLQFRQWNILRQGRRQSTGTIMQEDTIADVLNELARR